MSRKYVIFFLCTLTAVLSCSRNSEDFFFERGKGGIRLTLDTDYAVATKADVEEGPVEPDNFKIEIINSKGVIFKRWKTYADYKSEENQAFVMNAGGPYRIRATYGDSLASGFNALFFKGEEEFMVVPQETVDLSVVCRMANVKVAVVYGENIKKDYTDFNVNIKNSRGSLDFGKDCTEAGYLPVGDLSVTMELTDTEGKKWYFRNKSEISAAAGDFITLRMDTKKIPEMEVGVSITIDKTTDDHTVTVNLPSYMLPADAPYFTPVGFAQENKTVTFVEGTSPENASVNITAESGLQTCVMKVNSAYLINTLGWPSEIDFMNITPDVRNILSRDGVLYTDGMAGCTLANIDLKGLAKVFKYTDVAEDNTHSFTVTVTDAVGKSAEAAYYMVPVLAQKTVEDIPAADVWAVKAYVSMTTDGNPENLFPEISSDGISWTKPEYDQVSVDGNVRKVLIKGLTPGTAYSVRAGYNSYSSEVFKSMTTEAALQVGNAGFEEWTTETHYFTYKFFGSHSHDILWDKPWIGDKWWDVNSKKTMPSSTSVASDNWNWVRFPTVSYTKDAIEGEKAAMIYSVNVGDFVTSLAAVGIRVPGELFIGTADNSGNHVSDGHPFGSRPSAMRFQYKYQSLNNESFEVKIELKSGDNVIASAVRTEGGSVSDWSEMELPLQYSNMLSCATGIYISFKSTTADKPEVNGNYRLIIRDGEEYTGNFGSILYIDDIELIYE